MTQDKGIPYQRHRPSAALEKFLDPLDPGVYFDCGRARLHGLDDALVREAVSRGRTPGDDTFQLVATATGLIFCRPSISFAIAAPWDRVTVARPTGDDPVILPIIWPVHGELSFTVSKRLAGNVFRRWVQLQARSIDRDTVPPPLPQRPGSTPKPTPKPMPRPASASTDPTAVEPEVVEPGEVATEPASAPVPERNDLMAMNAFISTIDDEGMTAMLARMGAEDDETEAVEVGSGDQEDRPSVPASESEPASEEDAEAPETEAKIDEALPQPPTRPRPQPRPARGERVRTPVRRPEPPVISSAPVLSADGPPKAVARVRPAGHNYPAPNHRASIRPPTASITGPVGVRRADQANLFDPDRAAATSGFEDLSGRARTTGGVVKPSWVGSPTSLLVMMLLVSATVFTITTLVSVSRSDRGGGLVAQDGAPTARAGELVASPTTIDHRRLTRPGAADGIEARLPRTLPFGDESDPTPTTTPSSSVIGPEPRPGPARCNSNYSGCIPDVDDDDCPGQGDGPIFATEPAVVLGSDVYRLDDDGDGEIC